jgi:DNA-binding PadR family transcriptional regulator
VHRCDSFGGFGPEGRDLRRMFMGRHFGGRGSGRFAGGFMGPEGFGGGDFRTGRKLSSADLQLLILALLADKPRHGYELIKAFEERSKGFYSPSPGMVYPALTYLEELGHARVEAEGTRKLYHITPEGVAYLAQHRSTVDSILAQLEQVGQKMDRVRRFFSGEEDGEENVGPRGRASAFREVWMSYRQLGIALRQRRAHGSDHEKIVEILRRAAEEIRAMAEGGDAKEK